MNHPSYRFEVRKDNLNIGQIAAMPSIDDVVLGKDQAILAIEKFAVTSNTVTYGRAGDSFGYWKFFPASQPGMGCLPVWGIGRVVRSNYNGLEIGSRYYGYFSMSEYLVVTVGKANPRGFIEVSPHRLKLPILYNQYSLMSAETGFPEELDEYQIIYKPLFLTSFTIDYFLAENAFFGAETIILTSASSKTAMALAFLLQRNRDIHITALTSSSNAHFVRSLGIYSDVITYDEIETIDAKNVTVVDMAGSAAVVRDLRQHLGDRIAYFCGVGSTHWDADEIDGLGKLGGAPFVQYFAPNDIQRYNQEWGADVFQSRLLESWNAFIAKIAQFVSFEHKSPNEMETFYREFVRGANPSEAVIFVAGE